MNLDKRTITTSIIAILIATVFIFYKDIAAVFNSKKVEETALSKEQVKQEIKEELKKELLEDIRKEEATDKKPNIIKREPEPEPKKIKEPESNKVKSSEIENKNQKLRHQIVNYSQKGKGVMTSNIDKYIKTVTENKIGFSKQEKDIVINRLKDQKEMARYVYLFKRQSTPQKAAMAQNGLKKLLNSKHLVKKQKDYIRSVLKGN